jgi:carbon-monoxide dehydrogenase medium subunit
MIKDFTYLKPDSLKEALAMLSEHKDDECKVICGGQSLLILMRQGMIATDYLIDIKHIKELNYIKFDKKDGLRIGATATHRAIEKSDVIKKHYPALAELENRVANIQVRNWGTIGGNLAHADPAEDPAPLLLTYNAEIKVASAKGKRTMPLSEFLIGYFETALQKDEIIVEVHVPPQDAKTGAAYQKHTLLENDLGTVSAAACVTLDGNGKCKSAKIALGCAAETAIRIKRAEEVLIGKAYDEKAFAEAGKIASEDCDPVSDIHGSEAHRREIAGVLTKRMLMKAWERARA